MAGGLCVLKRQPSKARAKFLSSRGFKGTYRLNLGPTKTAPRLSGTVAAPVEVRVL
jgi:hypothetical protein